ncbi:DUF4867 family protein [Cohnella mopanensis]|uniref:DUF4867 family protein n=1 Tax=Cohnella mopanensis TaxID=2911966 RepID=UPI001EF9B153|nr:DUF4867 family protein [Cohnella mopanensis]
MSNYERIQQLNSHLTIHVVSDDSFKPFGKVIHGYDFTDLLQRMEHTTIPEEGNLYVASSEPIEQSPIMSVLQSNFYGEMDIQIGYCNGRNSTLNGLEYHKCSEINVAATDLILLLGDTRGIRDNRYYSDEVQAFFVPRGTAIEMYQTTLHFAPCKVTEEGFKCVVILLKGTNDPLAGEVNRVTEEDERLFMRNKWLLAHPERQVLIERGALPGIVGANIFVQSIGE